MKKARNENGEKHQKSSQHIKSIKEKFQIDDEEQLERNMSRS